MRAHHPPGFALLLLTFSLPILVMSPVGAQSEAQTPLKLAWSSTEASCDGASVAAKALQLVAPGVMLRPVEARAEVSRIGGEWVVRLEAGRGEQLGRRILRGGSCHEIQQAIALLLAMIMESREEPAAGPLPAEPASAPPPIAPTAPSTSATKPAVAPTVVPPAPSAAVATAFPTPSSPLADTPPPPSEMPAQAATGLDIRWFLRIGAGAGYGLKPGLTTGFGGGAGLTLGQLDVGAGVTHWPATEATVLAGPGRLAITRQNLGLRGCWAVWGAADFRVAPCLAPELTFFRFESLELLEDAKGAAGPLVTLTSTAELRYELAHRFTIWLAPGLTWETRQPFDVTLDCATPPCPTLEVYKTGGVGSRLEIGVDARF